MYSTRGANMDQRWHIVNAELTLPYLTIAVSFIIFIQEIECKFLRRLYRRLGKGYFLNSCAAVGTLGTVFVL
jgi:hypothetical protein